MSRKLFDNVGKWDVGECNGSAPFWRCRKEEWLWIMKWG